MTLKEKQTHYINNQEDNILEAVYSLKTPEDLRQLATSLTNIADDCENEEKLTEMLILYGVIEVQGVTEK